MTKSLKLTYSSRQKYKVEDLRRHSSCNDSYSLIRLLVCLMVFSATFNNISVISWRSVLLVEEIRGPGENQLLPVASH